MPDGSVDVAIVGGGPVGLAAAALLGKLGISCVLFEREATTSFHPRGHVVNARTMEIFRQIGIEAEVNSASLPVERHAGIGFVTSLAGEEIGAIRTRGDPVADALEKSWSPVLKRSCPQDLLEPILHRYAATCSSVSLRFSTEVTGLVQDDEGVDLSWASADGGKGRCRAAYVIAADGPRSSLRDLIGIEMSGESLGQQIGVYFHADLWELVKDRPFLLWWIYNAQTTGVLISLDGRHRWTYNFPYSTSEDRKDYTEARCKSLILAAIGTPDINVEIQSIVPWRMQARIANHLRSGRVFVAGDAAHPLPPTGGQGMNTGIADVHSLVWKLNLVLKGLAPRQLLETYEDERLPVASFNVRQSARNAQRMAEAGLSGILALDPEIASKVDTPDGAEVRKRLADAIPAQRGHFDYPGQTFGYAYRSGIVADGGPPPRELNVDRYDPSAAPGHRMPHFWVMRKDERISSIDLFDYEGFALLAGPQGVDWASAFRELVEQERIPGSAYVLGGSSEITVEDDSWLTLCGLSPQGAVLVRPDGHVAWRSFGGDENPSEALRHALKKAAGQMLAAIDTTVQPQTISA